MYSQSIERIKNGIHEKLNSISWPDLKIEKKADKSIVTEFDLFVSDLVKDEFKNSNPALNFYSEEDKENFEFPVIVLDPIDGTREFAKGYGECAVSLAILFSKDIEDKRNFGWIYNPFTGFEIDNLNSSRLGQRYGFAEQVNIMVSRSEWEKYVSKYDFDSNYRVSPIGSIALKLGLLGAGACDCVISFRDKNIWDIAAGTIICHSRGLAITNIKDLSQLHYKGPFIFSRKEYLERVERKVTSLIK